MWNFVKTTALLGFMSSILVFIGAIVGVGATGDWTGVLGGTLTMLIVAAIMNFGTWFIADTLVIKSTGAQPVPPGQLQWLHDDLAEVAAKAGIPTPRLYMVNNPSPNAFATGRSPKKGIVAVHSGLLNVLGRREVKGVLAHEVGHIKNRDTLVSAIAATLASAITFIAFNLRYMSRGRVNPIVSVLILLTAPVAALLIRMMISRTREYGADRRAAELTGDPEGLALALEGLRRGVQRTPDQNLAAQNVHHIMNGFAGGLGAWLSTHPPAEKRIQALRSMSV